MWRQSGIGRYLREVLPRVMTNWPEARWRLCGFPKDLSKMPAGEKVEWRRPMYGWREHFGAAPSGWHGADMRWVPHYNVTADTRGPLVVTVHDVLPLVMRDGWRGRVRGWVAERYFKRVADRAEKVLCPSQFSANGVVSSAGMERRRVRVTPLGVGEDFTQTETGRRERIWLYVGNVKPHKGLAALLAAMARSDANGHRLVIVGRREGFFTTAPELEQMAAILGGRVEWAGEVDELALRDWYARAEALVLPSTHEGFGLPVLEAMAAGCPVVAARAGALPEVAGEAALWFEAGDVEGLARKLSALANDGALRERLAGAGRRRAEMFTWGRTAELTAAALRETWEDAQ